MVELLAYVDQNDKNPFAAWFEELDPPAAARVTVALTRLEQGNTSNVKGVGAGVLEYKIAFRARLPDLFRARRPGDCHSAGRRHQEAPGG